MSVKTQGDDLHQLALEYLTNNTELSEKEVVELLGWNSKIEVVETVDPLTWESKKRLDGFVNLVDLDPDHPVCASFVYTTWKVAMPEGLKLDHSGTPEAKVVNKQFAKAVKKLAGKSSDIAKPFARVSYNKAQCLIDAGYYQVSCTIEVDGTRLAVHAWVPSDTGNEFFGLHHYSFAKVKVGSLDQLETIKKYALILKD